jgi:hypothetical protein
VIMPSRNVAGVVAAVAFTIGLVGLLTSVGGLCGSVIDSIFSDNGSAFSNGSCADAREVRQLWAWPMLIFGVVMAFVATASKPRATGRVTRRYHGKTEIIDLTGSDWLDRNTAPDSEAPPSTPEPLPRKKRTLGIRRPPSSNTQ